MKIETVEDLEKIVAEQNAKIEGLLTLVKAMDQKIRVYVQLVDIHEAALEQAGIMRPRAKEDPLAIN